MKKTIIAILLACVLVGYWYVSGEVYREIAQDAEQVTFTIEPGESVSQLADRLETLQIIRSDFFFEEYLKWKKLDRSVRAGSFTVEAPITLARVADALANPSQQEREITIIPGWTLRDIAEYFEEEGIASSTAVFALLGEPASIDTEPRLSVDVSAMLAFVPKGISYEGYIEPNTFRIFTNATIEDILTKLIEARHAQFTDQLLSDIKESGRTVHEVLTVASLLEKEVRGAENKKIVADIFWRRYDNGWPMQADSSVHYVHGTKGDVFTTKEMRESLNTYNTYKYPGLPPGPISTPSMLAIEAAVYPEQNNYWYFLTTLDTGEAKYARTLDEHNVNVQKYLR